MQLQELLKNYPHQFISGSGEVEISGLVYDSRQAGPGQVFFAVAGTKLDGHDFLEEVVKNSAAAAVISDQEKAARFKDKITLVKVPDTREALADLAAEFYRWPSEKLAVIGVTGTNGKTTTTYLIEQILTKAGFKTGLIGTVENRIGSKIMPHHLTTPESLDLQKMLAGMVEEGCQYAVMEVSSHSISMKRIRGVKFAVKILTNITQDHLDFHKTLEEYKKVKMDWMNEGQGLRLWPQDWQKEKITKKFTLPGKFNQENARCAQAVGRILKINEKTIDSALAIARSAPGRFEKIDEGQNFQVIVDFAHTPDGLEKLLRAAQEITKGKVITVFGCGGDRDRTKRPKMGYIAGLLSDYTIISSDNPRSEEPLEIIKEIENGLTSGLRAAAVDHYSNVIPTLKIKPKSDFLKEGGLGYEVEPDRRAAIERAISLAQPGDVVLLVGKGHEDCQIFKDKTIHFDDREVAREILARSVGRKIEIKFGAEVIR